MEKNRPSLKASLGVGGEEVARGEDVQGKGGWGVMAVASAHGLLAQVNSYGISRMALLG